MPSFSLVGLTLIPMIITIIKNDMSRSVSSEVSIYVKRCLYPSFDSITNDSDNRIKILYSYEKMALDTKSISCMFFVSLAIFITSRIFALSKLFCQTLFTIALAKFSSPVKLIGMGIVMFPCPLA